jgi:Zn-dependent metalloprotease
MSYRRNPLHCIVPPHILIAMAQADDPDTREWAMHSLLLSARFRGQRQVLGPMAAAMATATGQKHRSIYDANHTQRQPPAGKLVRDEDGAATSDPSVNEAYEGLGATYDLYHNEFNRNSIDNRGMRLDGYVHFGNRYDNAFWDGKEMVFGDGDGVVFDRFTKSIDVIGHELTHGVTENEAGLEYQDQPGALNESMSDVFGSLVKQYMLEQDAAQADWLIGAGLFMPGVKGKALRSMKAPGTAFNDPRLGGKDPQPGHMNDYVQTDDDNGGVHLNSGIPNHAFYLAATKIGGYAWKDPGQIWYTALRRLHPQTDFQEAANMTFQVAGELYGSASAQQQAVHDAWAQVGIEIAVSTAGRAVSRAGANGGTGQLEGRLKKAVEDAARKFGEDLAKRLADEFSRTPAKSRR